MKNLFKNKGLAFYFSCATLILAIIGLIGYTFANKAASGLVVFAYICGVVALVASVMSMFFDYYGIASIFVPALLIATALLAFVDNATSFALVINGVAQGESDMGGPNLAFWVCMISLLISSITATVGCFLSQLKIEKNTI